MYIVFRKPIHKSTKGEKFKLADKGIAKMAVDSNHLLVMEINMVSLSGSHKPDNKDKWKCKKVYKQVWVSK